MLSEFVAEHIPSWALQLPQVKETVAKKQIDDHAARQELADKRAAGVRARQEMLKSHEKELAPLLAADRAALKKLRAASEKAIATRDRQMIELAVNEREEKNLTRALLATVDPRIDEARGVLNEKWDRGRPKLSRSESRKTGRYSSLGHIERQAYSNAPAIQSLLDEILTARAAFDALKLANPDDVEAAIASILARVETAWTEVGAGALTPFGTPG